MLSKIERHPITAFCAGLILTGAFPITSYLAFGGWGLVLALAFGSVSGLAVLRQVGS